jgi:phosphoribosylformylglycinamidine synthase
MVLAVPQANLQRFLALCAAEDVEATAIGSFTSDGQLRVTHGGALLVDLAMQFLHDGRPQRVLEAVWEDRRASGQAGGDDKRASGQAGHRPLGRERSKYATALFELLAHPTIASKERIVRTYDHEVRGATVVKPLVGVRMDGPGDAAVLRPLPGSDAGLAIGCGINPRLGQIDPYWMALAAVDEALRNVVAVGADPARTAILDNFCWGDPKQPDRMAGLVRACAGCYDAAVAFGTPFVSGKDSLNNEYRDASGTRVAIPPTLLITALAQVADVRRCVTMDLKLIGSPLYLVGATRNELLGGYLLAVLAPAEAARLAEESELPRVDLAVARATFAALHAAISAGLVRACHDLSEGGLGVAAAEMAIAGGLGLELDLRRVDGPGDALLKLFSESPSRFLVETAPEHAAAFEAAMAGLPLARVGTSLAEPELRLRNGDSALERFALDELRAAWQSGLDGIEL